MAIRRLRAYVAVCDDCGATDGTDRDGRHVLADTRREAIGVMVAGGWSAGARKCEACKSKDDAGRRSS